MNLASTLRSQPIAARLRLGFGAMLLMMAGIAAVGLLALQSANQQMREITGAGAAKARLVNAMLETVSTAGIQSRSAAMLNEIDGAQARTQIAAARASLQHYQKQEAELVQLLSAADSPVQHALVRDIEALAQKGRPELESALQAAEDGDTVSATLALMMARSAPRNPSVGRAGWAVCWWRWRQPWAGGLHGASPPASRNPSAAPWWWPNASRAAI